MTDAVSRAYAQLGLAPGASPDRLRKQYRALVRRWHPDRFARDPQGQSEAAVRMRAINDAYHLLVERTARAPDCRDPAPPVRARGESLTREEIDRMVQALGTEGPVDLFLGSLRSVSQIVWTVLGVAVLAVLSLKTLFALLRGGWSAVQSDPRLFLVPFAVAVVLIVWVVQSRSQGRKE